MKKSANKLVEALLDEAPPSVQPMRIPIKFRRSDGQVVDGEFTGYYSAKDVSVGYTLPNGGTTHGVVSPDKILTRIPNFDEWYAWLQAERKKYAPTEKPAEVSAPSYAQTMGAVRDAFS